MPKSSNIENTIPKLYRRSALNQMMFAYVCGCRSALHTLSITACISLFMHEFGLTEEDYNSDSARVEYNKMRKELINLNDNET